MKKSTILFVLILGAVLLLLFTPAISADQFGVKGGVNFSYLSNAKLLDLELSGVDIPEYAATKVGGSAGIFYKIDINRFLAIQPEIYFSMRGGRFTFTGIGSLDVDLNFIEIPILLKLRLPLRPGKFSTHLFAGPFVAFGTSSGLQVEISRIGSFSTDLDRENDSGLVLGVSLESIPAPGRGSIIFETRLILGMNRLFGENFDIKNISAALMVGYAFGKKLTARGKNLSGQEAAARQ